jgi:hypothetical protein
VERDKNPVQPHCSWWRGIKTLYNHTAVGGEG